MAGKGGGKDRDAVLGLLDSGLALPRKRSLTVAGHRTSITLEDAFWHELQTAASEMDLSVTALVSMIDASREPAGLSAAIRVFLLGRTTAALKELKARRV